MDDQAYVSEKKNFYANLNGTTFDEVSSLIISLSFINFLDIFVKIFICHVVSVHFLSNFWLSFSIDYLFCVIPLIALVTILSDWLHLILILFVLVIPLIYARLLKTKLKWVGQNNKIESEQETVSIDRKCLKLSVSTYRTWVYMLTCVSILAVDFRIFPRRFAKTETYGISAMDLGVAFYIVCHAVKFIRSEKGSNNHSKNSHLKSFLKELKNSSILIAFGALRLISVKATGYVEHESEYGRHWNFFFTIVVVKLIANLLEPVINKSSVRSLLIGVTIAGFYQYVLSYKHLSSHILSLSRNENSLIDLNREGIFSCLGYLSIYLIAQALFLRLDSILRHSELEKSPKEFGACLKCLSNVIIFSLVAWIVFEISRRQLENVSRRLCNLSFISLNVMLSTLFFGFFMICTMLVAKIYYSSSSLSDSNENKTNYDKNELIARRNRRLYAQLDKIFSFFSIMDSKFMGIFNFFLSNILTGIVNLLVNTLRISHPLALLILSVYSFISFAIPFVFYRSLMEKRVKSN